MAYGSTSKANLKQTAFNVAGTVTAALVQAGIVKTALKAKEALSEFTATVFDDLVMEHDAEPKEAEKPNRHSNQQKSGSGSSITKEDAAGTALNWGKFKGLTLKEVAGLSAEGAAEYGYENGSGKQYLQWLAKQTDSKVMGFMARRAKLLVEAARSGVDASQPESEDEEFDFGDGDE